MKSLAIAAILCSLPMGAAFAQQAHQYQTQGYKPGQPTNYNEDRQLEQLENESRQSTPTPTPTPTPSPSATQSDSNGGWQDAGASRGPN